MAFGSLIDQLRGISGALPTMSFGSAPAAPALPADGAMQPTIGPGMPAAPVAGPTFKPGLPSGGLLAMMRGQQNPQGLVGLLQQLSAGRGGAPLSGSPPGAGMLGSFNGRVGTFGGAPVSPLPGQPGALEEGPIANLPLDIKPMDQF